MEINKGLNGIRGIAILLVVFYHYFPKLMPNGFIGVDIFFVISGYLIQSMMYRKEFTLQWFYSNRIKRILPPLIIILIILSIISNYFLLDDEYKNFNKYLEFSTNFKLNYYLANENSYFDSENNKKILIHLWSLCVEIHYYLLWPVIFIAINKNFTKQKNSFLILLCITSFILYIFYSYNNKIFTFYLSQNRFWQLIIGALCYQFKIKISDNVKFFDVYGIILLIISLLFIEENKNYPGFISIVPTLAACFIILNNSNGILNRHVISNKIFSKIGILSYEIYLWHWPLFTLITIISPDKINNPNKIFLLVTTLILSIFTKFICDGIRKIKINSLLFPIILIAINIFSNKLYNDEITIYRPINVKYDSYLSSLKFSPKKEYCHDIEYAHLIENWYCKLGNSNKDIDYFVFGDSHAMSLLPVIDLYADEEKLSIGFSSTSACPPILNFEKRTNSEIIQKYNCKEINNKIIKFITNNHVKNIVMISRWADYDYETLKIELNNIMSYYKSLDINIYILDDNPLQKYTPQDALRLSEITDESINKLSITKDEHIKNQNNINDIFNELSTKYNFFRLNFDNDYCPNNLCILSKNNKFNYYDNGHLSTSGSLQIYASFKERMNEIRARKNY